MTTFLLPRLTGVGISLALLIPSTSFACSVSMGGVSYPSIQAAVNVAPMIATINVDGTGGTCSENVLIPNVTLRLIIYGANGASITGGPTAPTLDVRVKGFFAQNITINGGSRGINLRRNANAIFDHVTVQNAVDDGIRADSMALAVVTSSQILNNGGSGIYIEQLAAGRIGSNLPEDGSGAAGNTIQGNGGDGVTVAYTASADIYANTIASNKGNGISIERSSSASIADNVINNNTLSGISVTDNSSVDLPTTTPTTDFRTSPNTTTTPNTQYGIYCDSGGTIAGHLGSTNPLNGGQGKFGGPTGAAFAASCPNAASTLLTP